MNVLAHRSVAEDEERSDRLADHAMPRKQAASRYITPEVTATL
jgi:hypothetical protein